MPSLLEKRLHNAEQLEQLYRERLALGDANQMEYNKIQLEKVNANNASRRNAAALRAQLELLQSLNGGLPIEFSDTAYAMPTALPAYEELESAYLAADPNLKSLNSESESAQREIKVNRALTLPKFDLGYRRNGGSSETLNGFRIGMSIPLWENRNTVKQAKAKAEYAVLNLEDNTQTLKATLRDLYLQAQALETSCNEYAQTISMQRTEDLLNRALISGQISMVDYFVEISLLYDSIQNCCTTASKTTWMWRKNTKTSWHNCCNISCKNQTIKKSPGAGSGGFLFNFPTYPTQEKQQ